MNSRVVIEYHDWCAQGRGAPHTRASPQTARHFPSLRQRCCPRTRFQMQNKKVKKKNAGRFVKNRMSTAAKIFEIDGSVVKTVEIVFSTHSQSNCSSDASPTVLVSPCLTQRLINIGRQPTSMQKANVSDPLRSLRHSKLKFPNPRQLARAHLPKEPCPMRWPMRRPAAGISSRRALMMSRIWSIG